MINDNNTIRASIRPNLCISSIVALIALTPYLTRISTVQINFVLFLLWVVTAMNSGFFRLVRSYNEKGMLKWWCLFFLLLVISSIVGHSNTSLQTAIVRIVKLAVPLQFMFILKNYNYRESVLLLKIILSIFCYSLISNMIIGVTNPMIYETLNHAASNDADYNTNAGSTSFVTACLFLLPSLYFLYNAIYNNTIKVLLAVLGLMSLLMIVVINSRGTALFMLILMLVGFYIVRKGISFRHKYLFASLILLFLVLFWQYGMLPFLSFLEDLFSNATGMSGRLSSRMADLSATIEGGGIEFAEEGSFVHRVMLWQASINTFTSNFSNFIIGIGEDEHDYDFVGLIAAGISDHSEWLDNLAKYGIIGGYILLKAISFTFKTFLDYASDTLVRDQMIVIFLIFCIFSLVNGSLNPTVLFSIFGILPLVVRIINYSNT